MAQMILRKGIKHCLHTKFVRILKKRVCTSHWVFETDLELKISIKNSIVENGILYKTIIDN